MEPMSCRTSPAFLLGCCMFPFVSFSERSGRRTLELDRILIVPAFSFANGIPDSLSKLEFLLSCRGDSCRGLLKLLYGELP